MTDTAMLLAFLLLPCLTDAIEAAPPEERPALREVQREMVAELREWADLNVARRSGERNDG